MITNVFIHHLKGPILYTKNLNEDVIVDGKEMKLNFYNNYNVNKSSMLIN